MSIEIELKDNLKSYLAHKKSQHESELSDYVEQYYKDSVASFPKSICFSNEKRDFHNMAMSLWLGLGQLAVESDNNELYQEFIDTAQQAGFLQQEDIKRLNQ